MHPETNPQAQAKVVVHEHPTASTFVKVGGVLAVLTAVEFSIIYVKGLGGLVPALLFILALTKFYLVAQYFMHLRFDNRLLRWIFAAGFVLATLIAIAQNFVNKA